MIIYIRCFLLGVILSNSTEIFSQDNSIFGLDFYADVLTNASATGNRVLANDIFKKGLVEALSEHNSFSNTFSEIPWLFVKYDPDSTFRLISWQLEREKDDFVYYNFHQKSNGEYTSFGNQIENISERETYLLSNVYSALFHSLVPFKDYFLVSGYRKIEGKRTQRICDILKIDDGQPIFGRPIFNKDETTPNGRGKKRVILTYSSVAKANLNVNVDDGIIIFDHIIGIPSKNPDEPGFILVPDGSYEAYEYSDNEVWMYKEKLYDQVQATPLDQPLKSNKTSQRDIFQKAR